MNQSHFVIAGGGMVAGYAAKQMVELGLKPGQLTILSADTSTPYERPPLSKGFLAGRDAEESIRINPGDFYPQHGIELRLGARIERVDPSRKSLALASGEEVGFDQLIVATGSRVRKLSIPGAGLAGVHYLRSLDDSRLIRSRAAGVKSALVLGGGFIGMEVAAVLAQLNVDVTMVVADDRIWKRFFSPQMSEFFQDHYQRRGVRLILSAKLQELRGEDTVTSALLEDGRTIDCGMVVAGIGVTPVSEWLNGTGIDISDGVRVNEYLETAVPWILAAGDVANYVDLVFEKRRRVEHWDNAVSQGQHCARTLMGRREPFRHVPYFFSDVFDLSYEFWGDTSGAGQIVHRGDLTTNSFSVWWLRNSTVVAAFAMNRPDEERTVAPAWIEARQTVSAQTLGRAAEPIQAAETR